MYLYSDCPRYFCSQNELLSKPIRAYNTNYSTLKTKLENSNFRKATFLTKYSENTASHRKNFSSIDSNKDVFVFKALKQKRMLNKRNKLSEFENSEIKTKISLKVRQNSESDGLKLSTNIDFGTTTETNRENTEKETFSEAKMIFNLTSSRNAVPEERKSILSLKDDRKLEHLFKEPDKKEDKNIIKTVFNKNLVNTLKNKTSRGFNNFTEESMYQLKKKVYFMKGVMDYIYPKYIKMKYNKQNLKEEPTESVYETEIPTVPTERSVKPVKRKKKFYIKAPKRVLIRPYGAKLNKVRPVKVYCPLIIQKP